MHQLRVGVVGHAELVNCGHAFLYAGLPLFFKAEQGVDAAGHSQQVTVAGVAASLACNPHYALSLQFCALGL